MHFRSKLCVLYARFCVIAVCCDTRCFVNTDDDDDETSVSGACRADWVMMRLKTTSFLMLSGSRVLRCGMCFVNATSCGHSWRLLRTSWDNINLSTPLRALFAHTHTYLGSLPPSMVNFASLQIFKRTIKVKVKEGFLRRRSDGMELASRLSLGPCSEYWQFQIGFKDSSLRSAMGRLAH